MVQLRAFTPPLLLPHRIRSGDVPPSHVVVVVARKQPRVPQEGQHHLVEKHLGGQSHGRPGGLMAQERSGAGNAGGEAGDARIGQSLAYESHLNEPRSHEVENIVFSLRE